MFEYMAAGLPVIAADFPRFREILEGNRCGICVPPRDPAAIAAAIEWVFDHPVEAAAMGRRGRSVVLDSFNWEGQERALLQLYQRILV
jgi:glycosyltransferase involved in cell wall biosynthesis